MTGLGLDGREAAVDLPIVQAVISLAHGLGIDVVAEGIEGPGQLECLRDLACDRGQGYWFARPLPDELEAILAASAPLPGCCRSPESKRGPGRRALAPASRMPG